MLLSMSFINSCMPIFELTGKLNLSPNCNKFETCVGMWELDKFINYFSFVLFRESLELLRNSAGEIFVLITVSLFDVYGLWCCLINL